jgi:hypothetical protein
LFLIGLHADRMSSSAATRSAAVAAPQSSGQFWFTATTLGSGSYEWSATACCGTSSPAQAQLLDGGDFTHYGLVGGHLNGLRHRFALWRADLVDPAGPR